MTERVVKAKNYLQQRKRAYGLTFTGVHGESVLKDLAKFCRANESCFHPDPRVHAALEGRREVFLRIQQHLGLSEDQMFNLFVSYREEEK